MVNRDGTNGLSVDLAFAEQLVFRASGSVYDVKRSSIDSILCSGHTGRGQANFEGISDGTIWFAVRITSNIKYVDPEIDEFLKKHSAWTAAAEADDDVLYCLNQHHVDGRLRLFRLEEDYLRAERDLVDLCHRHYAIGLRGNQFVRNSLLGLRLPWPPAIDKSELEGMGWEPSLVADVRIVLIRPRSLIAR